MSARIAIVSGTPWVSFVLNGGLYVRAANGPAGSNVWVSAVPGADPATSHVNQVASADIAPLGGMLE